MVCVKCKAQIPDGISFCPKCGAAAAPEKRCPKCGSVISAGISFCTKCGTPLTGPAPVQSRIRRHRGSTDLPGQSCHLPRYICWHTRLAVRNRAGKKTDSACGGVFDSRLAVGNACLRKPDFINSADTDLLLRGLQRVAQICKYRHIISLGPHSFCPHCSG